MSQSIRYLKTLLISTVRLSMVTELLVKKIEGRFCIRDLILSTFVLANIKVSDYVIALGLSGQKIPQIPVVWGN